MLPEFIDLNVAYVKRECITAISKGDVPATPVAEPYYVLYVYVNTQQILISYATQEERDAKYDEVKSLL